MYQRPRVSVHQEKQCLLEVLIKLYISIGVGFISLYSPFEIGVWKSWQKDGLDIKDIVWPGNSHTPPHGVPEKFYLRITFLEESPYINLAPPDPISGKCLMDRGVYCRVAKKSDIKE
ncbi:Protein of unknown function [Cotesia congregata]|uniref:Uncharacterized protein n=1 Tax=Cotesia congregata TaxID=51543 RepID=A0A8J2MPL0_COTCN|nr:Protein of unknown function [Cotesia congregata]